MNKQEKKQFEQQLQIAMNQFLRDQQSLKNGNGAIFCLGNPACSNLYISLRGEYEKNILSTYLETPTNIQPCLSGYVNLSLKKDGESEWTNNRYFFHICAQKYELSMDNETIQITIKDVDYFSKQEDTYF